MIGLSDDEPEKRDLAVRIEEDGVKRDLEGGAFYINAVWPQVAYFSLY